MADGNVVKIDPFKEMNGVMFALGESGFPVMEFTDEDGLHRIRMLFSCTTEYRDIGTINFDISSGRHVNLADGHREAVLFAFEKLREQYNIFVGDFSYMLMAEKRRLYDMVNSKANDLKELLGLAISEVGVFCGRLCNARDAVTNLQGVSILSGLRCLDMLASSVETLIGKTVCCRDNAMSVVEKVANLERRYFEVQLILQRHGTPMRFDAEISYYGMLETFEDAMVKAVGAAPDVYVVVNNGKYAAFFTIPHNDNLISVCSDEKESIYEAKVEVYFKAVKHVRDQLGFEVCDVYSVALSQLESVVGRFDVKARIMLKASKDIENALISVWSEIRREIIEFLEIEKCMNGTGPFLKDLKQIYMELGIQYGNVNAAIQLLKNSMVTCAQLRKMAE